MPTKQWTNTGQETIGTSHRQKVIAAMGVGTAEISMSHPAVATPICHC